MKRENNNKREKRKGKEREIGGGGGSRINGTGGRTQVVGTCQGKKTQLQGTRFIKEHLYGFGEQGGEMGGKKKNQRRGREGVPGKTLRTLRGLLPPKVSFTEGKGQMIPSWVG